MHWSLQPSWESLNGNPTSSSTKDLENEILKCIYIFFTWTYRNPKVLSLKKLFHSKIVFDSGSLLLMTLKFSSILYGKLAIKLNRMKVRKNAAMKKYIFSSWPFIWKCISLLCRNDLFKCLQRTLWKRLQFMSSSIAFIIHQAQLCGPHQLYILDGHHLVHGGNTVPIKKSCQIKDYCVTMSLKYR